MKNSKKSLLIAPLVVIIIGFVMWLVMGWSIGWVMILGGIAFAVVLLILKSVNDSKEGIKKYGVQKAFVSLGDMKGKTHEQIVSVCGNPRKITPTSEGTKEEWWGLISHFVIRFDKNGNFVTIERQSADSPSFRNMAIIFIACCVIASIYMAATGGAFKSNNTGEVTVKCESCEHSFKKGSENARSIARTHMCTKCYNSYKELSDWLNEQPVD